MKLVSKLALPCAALLTLIGFILIMATPAVLVEGESVADGIRVIFGGDNVKPVWAGLMSWIFALIGILAFACLAALPFIKVELPKIAILGIHAGAAILVLLAGIFSFCIKAATVSGSWTTSVLNYSIGAGWVIAGILFVIAAIGSLIPVVLPFLKK